jgi:hypothetical protein
MQNNVNIPLVFACLFVLAQVLLGGALFLSPSSSFALWPFGPHFTRALLMSAPLRGPVSSISGVQSEAGQICAAESKDATEGTSAASLETETQTPVRQPCSQTAYPGQVLAFYFKARECGDRCAADRIPYSPLLYHCPAPPARGLSGSGVSQGQHIASHCILESNVVPVEGSLKVVRAILGTSIKLTVHV